MIVTGLVTLPEKSLNLSNQVGILAILGDQTISNFAFKPPQAKVCDPLQSEHRDSDSRLRFEAFTAIGSMSLTLTAIAIIQTAAVDALMETPQSSHRRWRYH